MEKQYKIGVVIGRFQPFHNGHECVLEQALELCEQVVVVIGSAQESRIPHNPLTAAEREAMIRDSFYDELEVNPNRILFLPLADRAEFGNNASWGEYVMKAIQQQFHITPSVIFEGYEAERRDWYGSLSVTVIQISRNVLPISATEIREAILKGDKQFYEAWCANGTEHWFNFLKGVLEECENKRKQ